VADGTIDAFIDTFGDSYIELALELGVKRDRINTIIDFAGAAKHGTKAEANANTANAAVLAELATLIADGDLEIPIANVYRLDEVRDAYRELERRHTRGKIVLKP
jgi:NADPH:quinone reductase-like Zn-dependent oxidoreductase